MPRTTLSALAALALLLAAACAQKTVPYRLPAGATAVEIEASSFAFAPEIIHARAGEILLLRVRNASGSEHNLTVLEPDGIEVVDVALATGEVTEVRLPLQGIGTYRFYCDKTLHATFGMEGRIVAEER